MKTALINKDNYKIIFNDETELYKVLKTQGGYHHMTEEEFEDMLYEPNTRICFVDENNSLKDYSDKINNDYYCIWMSKLNKMSLYKYTDGGNKFIKNIDLMSNIEVIAKYADKHLCSI